MAEIAASLAGPVIDVMRWVAAPIVRQFNYLCCFTANITNLQREAEELANAARGLQERVNRELENLQVIEPMVESWLTKSKGINDQTNEILGEVPNVRSGCLKLRARFSLSKSAKKTTDRMKELRGQCDFTSISQQGPPAATRVVPRASGTTLEFESRNRFEEDIMTTLRLGEVKIIGICGMGGLGKTTMAKRIRNRVLEEHIFEEAVTVVISQPVDELKVQVEIGKTLGLNLKDEPPEARVQKLHERLSDAKRTLLVLDDVWDGLELGDLGVPCDSSWCTVLITSRNDDALNDMNVQKVFGMKVLKEEEAWSLFREKAGTCVDDSGLNSIARKVVKECNGLPLALTTLGASLKDEKCVRIWEDALDKLRKSVHNTPKVHNPLKLSYERLPYDEARYLFLLFCLFPEDDYIPLEKLTYFCMGLEIYEGINNVEKARNRTLSVTKILKSRSLLLDGDDDNYVRMHDVVRDVCIFIAKQEGFIGGNDCTWISYYSQLPPTRLEFPKLRLLSLMSSYNLKQESELDSAFFEGSRCLNVLYINNYYSLTSLPHTTDSLTNLKTLVLQSCWELKTISAVGELVNLEILICRWCGLIEELPLEIKVLKRLKLFELSNCSGIQTIGGGIISSLVGLEELKIVGSFKKWEAEDSELKENARLGELEDLTNLTCLEIEIEDAALAAQQMKILSKLQRFNITFESIAQQGPPAATRVVPLGTMFEFESRKRFEEDLMKTLRLGEVKIIGICGMGGLGKTTMARRIRNRVLEEHIFEEAVMVIVSLQVDKTKIQEEIGGSLGLDLKKESSQARKQKLHERLSAEKRTLLVLDDVWDRLELADLGVPCDSRWCTVLITSRNNDVLKYMNVQKVFGMKVLKEEEAWSLFREKAGTCVDDSGLNSIAREVVKECKGLPLALTTLGASLKDEKCVRIWEDALDKLRKSVHNTPKVHNPLKLSYERLPYDEARYLFLLFCLFPEDDYIPLEKLTYFCMGLEIYEGINNVEEARNRTLALTRMLKSRSLLLDGDDGNYVRMHDVIRDVCIFIAKQEGFIGGNDCTWISYYSQLPPTRLEFPKLRLLSLTDLEFEEKEQEPKLDSAFFEGSRGLNVLYIKRSYSLTSLPHTTDSVTNLKTLVLESCGKLKTISVVGKLVNLEILICRECTSIEELPLEIKRLKRLKLFELSRCHRLQTIGGGIISSLVGLEELKIVDSFKKWEAEDSELKENARLRELETLTNLTCLVIEIEDAALAAERINISSKLQRFNITFSNPFSESFAESIRKNSFYSYPSHKKLSARLNGGIGDWLRRDTECLYLSGRGANNVELAKYQNMRWLGLESCEAMKNIVRSSVVDNATVFPSLEYLLLESLPQLEEISDAPISSTSFKNLSSIEIAYCHSLRNLGQLSIAGKDCLLQLQHLSIKWCEKMEQVFLWNENTNPQTITKIFPRLEKVELRDLPNLATFYQGIEAIEFPLLTKLKIQQCPKFNFLNGMGSNENKAVESNNADIQHYLHLFCQKVSFGNNLKKLRVDLNPFCTHEIHASSFDGFESLQICYI